MPITWICWHIKILANKFTFSFHTFFFFYYCIHLCFIIKFFIFFFSFFFLYCCSTLNDNISNEMYWQYYTKMKKAKRKSRGRGSEGNEGKKCYAITNILFINLKFLGYTLIMSGTHLSVTLTRFLFLFLYVCKCVYMWVTLSYFHSTHTFRLNAIITALWYSMTNRHIFL